MAGKIETLSREADLDLAGQETRAASLKLFATLIATVVPAIVGVAVQSADSWPVMQAIALVMAGVSMGGAVLVFEQDQRDGPDARRLAAMAGGLTLDDIQREALRVKLACLKSGDEALAASRLALIFEGGAGFVAVVLAGVLVVV